MKKIIKPVPKQKKVKKEDPIFIGDNIITTDKFIFGPNIRGRIILKKLEFFGVELLDKFSIPKDLEKEYYPHNLNGLLKEKNGYVLDKNDFVVVDRPEFDNKIKEMLYYKIKEKQYIKYSQIPKQIERNKSEQESYYSRINDYKQEIRRFEKRLKEIELEIKKLSSIELNYDSNEADYIYNKLVSTKKIHKVSITDNYLVVTTKSLNYSTDRYSRKFSFPLGRFKIFIPFDDENRNIKAINITRQLGKGYYGHPCLENCSNICMGDQVRHEIRSYIQSGDYYGIVLLLINFFEQPDYGTPYRKDYEFYCAQPVTVHKKIKKEEDWLDPQIYMESDWDEKKYQKDLDESRKKYSPDTCSNCGEEMGDCDCDYCSDCGELVENCSCSESEPEF